jgi:hypothetical protein
MGIAIGFLLELHKARAACALGDGLLYVVAIESRGRDRQDHSYCRYQEIHSPSHI